MTRRSHDRGIEAREARMIAIGTPYTRNSEGIVKAHQHTLGMRNRDMRATIAELMKSVESEVDLSLSDMDYMQESLIVFGMMANPEQPAIALLDALGSIGAEMRKEMGRVSRKVTEVQAMGRQRFRSIPHSNGNRKSFQSAW